jgi:hypothetical protein
MLALAKPRPKCIAQQKDAESRKMRDGDSSVFSGLGGEEG